MIKRIIGAIIILPGLLLALPPLAMGGISTWEWAIDGFERYPTIDTLHITGIDHAFRGWEIIVLCSGMFIVGAGLIWFGWNTMIHSNNESRG